MWEWSGADPGRGGGGPGGHLKTPRFRGGGGTDSLSWGTDLETTAPLLGHGQPLVLPSSNLQPPLFMKAK